MNYRKFLFALFLSCATLCSSVPLCAGDRGADEPTTPAAIYGQGVRETNKRSPAEELAGFHLPTGFVAELVASEPQIAKPLNMAFDARGRLWVTDTTEYPYPVPAGQEAHDSIKVLTDLDRNGSFESVTTFASGLNIPIGILPVEDGVICFSIPNIMHLKDTDGDGQCDETKVLLGPFDTTRDTHGMVNALRRGTDGWIYACHGFNNQSHVKAADGSEIHLMSGNTFRFRADGSHVEQFTTGQVNPFGMTSDQWGNWFTADCHSKPVTMLVRGGHYESFGRPHDGLGFVPAVMDHLHGSTAICGISYYMAEEYPPEFRDKFYSGNVMTSRINCNRWQVDRDRLRLVEEPDFMTSDDPWFRPVDVQLGADGALYVADFYNKIIGHYEVRLDHPERDRTSGRIWRIVYRGSPAQAVNNKPLENKPGQDSIQVAGAASLFSAEHLAELTHANATRRHFALERIRTARLSPAEQAQLIEFQRPAAGRSDWLRIAAIWSLHTHGLDNETTLADALTQASPQVTVAVLKAWADRGRADEDSRAADSRQLLRTAAQQALASDTPQVALAAADALSQHGTADDVTQLLNQIQLRTSQAAIVPHAMRIAVKRLLTRQEIADRVLIRLTDVASATPSSNRPILDASKIDDWLTQASILPAVDTPRAAAALLAMVTSIQDKRMAAYRAPALQLACKHMRPEFAEPVVALLASLRDEDASLTGKEKSTVDLLSSELDQQSILAMEALNTLRSGQHPVPPPLSQLLQQKLTNLATAMDGELRAPDASKVIVWQATGPRSWQSEDRKRRGEGDQTYKVLSSLTLGESYVGTLSTAAFACPSQLTFWLAGHDGIPDMPALGKNFVRLVRVDTGDILQTSPAPRNDVARRIQWSLDEHAGQMVRLECVDGDSGNAYAWIAVGGFSLSGLNPSPVDGAMLKLARYIEAIGTSGLAENTQAIESMLTSKSLGDDARCRLASSCAAARGMGLGKLLADAALLKGQGANVTRDLALGEGAAYAKACKDLAIILASHMTLSQQTLLARGLISSQDGRRLLLELVDEGRMAPQSLRTIKELLTADAGDAIAQRLVELSQAASVAPSQVEQAIATRIANFRPSAGDYEKGKLLYEKNCANCHKLRGTGQLVGPQLDGVGPRGFERLAEDIWLPNRNVDKAFRMTSILTEDERVMVGLLRELDNGQLQLVGTDGKSQSVDKNTIASRKETTRSLMPDNFAELISDSDLAHLLQFITSESAPTR